MMVDTIRSVRKRLNPTLEINGFLFTMFDGRTNLAAQVVREVKKYFADKKSAVSVIIRVFLLLLLIFAVAFFLWSVMRYNEIMQDKEEREVYKGRLDDDIDRLEYLVDAPLDDAFKIRIARERLGMCFPDEIIYHTELN